MIDEHALVSPKATIHDNVTIGPLTVIGDDVEIGSGTRVESHVVIKGPTRIGEDNHIFQFASIGDDPQDMKFAGEATRLVIGNGNTIREYVSINRGTAQDQGETRIGNDNWIMAYVHIAHDCVIGDHTIFANGAALAGHVNIGDYAILGGYSGVHQFCRVGPHAFLGMYAGVGRDVPAYVMVMGYPPEPRGVNVEGLKRRDFSAEQIKNIRDAYRVIYRQGRKLAEAVDELTIRVATQPELMPLLESLRNSERSILR